jgi:uncharacterized cofD-like protein
MNRVLAVRGQVLPATATPLTLHARLGDGSVVDGQSRIMRTPDIREAWISPADARASDDAIAAIAEAELVVIGPGSLYTSLLPSLMLPEIRDAIAAAPGVRVYVCNVATQEGETADLDLAGHVDALIAHTVPGLVDVVLANNRFGAEAPPDWPARPVQLRWPPSGEPVPHLDLNDVVDPGNAHHHDPERLADALMAILEREGMIRRRGMAAGSRSA